MPPARPAVVSSWGFVITPDALTQLAQEVGEKTLLSRTGGAPTLAVGMAAILSGLFGRTMMGIWYHFAILFEALFILTTVDAGTRVTRFMIQDMVGSVVPAFQRTNSWFNNIVGSGTRGGGVGLFPLPGRDRSHGRNQYAVASVRHFEPDAGRDRADHLQRRSVQDEARALRLGDADPDGLAPCLHADGRLAKGV